MLKRKGGKANVCGSCSLLLPAKFELDPSPFTIFCFESAPGFNFCFFTLEVEEDEEEEQAAVASSGLFRETADEVEGAADCSTFLE